MTTEKIFKWSILAYSVVSYGFVFGVFMMDKPKKDQLITHEGNRNNTYINSPYIPLFYRSCGSRKNSTDTSPRR